MAVNYNTRKGESIHQYVERLYLDIIADEDVTEIEAKKIAAQKYQNVKKNERKSKR